MKIHIEVRQKGSLFEQPRRRFASGKLALHACGPVLCESTTAQGYSSSNRSSPRPPSSFRPCQQPPPLFRHDAGIISGRFAKNEYPSRWVFLLRYSVGNGLCPVPPAWNATEGVSYGVLKRIRQGSRGGWSAKNRWDLLPCSAQPAGRFCSAQKFKRSPGRRPSRSSSEGRSPGISAAPRVLFRCVLRCSAQRAKSSPELTNGLRGIEDELLARWAGRYREQKGDFDRAAVPGLRPSLGEPTPLRGSHPPPRARNRNGHHELSE